MYDFILHVALRLYLYINNFMLMKSHLEVNIYPFCLFWQLNDHILGSVRNRFITFHPVVGLRSMPAVFWFNFYQETTVGEIHRNVRLQLSCSTTQRQMPWSCSFIFHVQRALFSKQTNTLTNEEHNFSTTGGRCCKNSLSAQTSLPLLTAPWSCSVHVALIETWETLWSSSDTDKHVHCLKITGYFYSVTAALCSVTVWLIEP